MSSSSSSSSSAPAAQPTTTTPVMVEAKDRKTTVSEKDVRPSISVRLIRHAESHNNEVYRNARYIYRGGTPDFDERGWNDYVETHRSADPGLSAVGREQAARLADFFVPHLRNQASAPVRIITSPMRRTLETLRPTLQGLLAAQGGGGADHHQQQDPPNCQVLVHGFYFESEGCHTRDRAEEGLNPTQIRDVLGARSDEVTTTTYPKWLDFEGFPDMQRGWYCHGTGAETRAQSEERASKFYLWLCEYLDQELATPGGTATMSVPLTHQQQQQQQQPQPPPDDQATDVFDAGVAIPGEEMEDENDKWAPRKRRRRTTLLLGHGDFMGLVLRRIVAGFGHVVEQEGCPHRSAFVHVNTGITELEYFGQGRFLVMGSNQTPHFAPHEYGTLRTGGSLKDGWSYLMPNDEFVLYAEVSVAFSDEEMEGHVREQTQALKSLYMSSTRVEKFLADQQLQVEQQKGEHLRDHDDDDQHQSRGEGDDDKVRHFIVKRGLQVVGVATYSEKTGQLTDVAVQPSAAQQVSETLFHAVQKYSRQLGRSGSLLVMPRYDEHQELFQSMGFEETVTDEK